MYLCVFLNNVCDYALRFVGFTYLDNVVIKNYYNIIHNYYLNYCVNYFQVIVWLVAGVFGKKNIIFFLLFSVFLYADKQNVQTKIHLHNLQNAFTT
jgi:hypothetical protein